MPSANEELSFVSWKEGSTTWKLGNLLSSMCSKFGAQLKLVSKVDDSGGLSLPLRVARGEFDVVATYPHSAKWAFDGLFAYSPEKRASNLRAIAFIDRPSWLVIALARDTGLTSIRDIKERRYPLKLITTARKSLTGDVDRDCFFSANTLSEEEFLNWGGKLFEIFKDIDTSQVGPYLRDGKADAVATYGEPLLRFWQEATVWRDLIFVSPEQGALDLIAKKYRVDRGTIEAGTFRGQTGDVSTIAYPGWVIVCRDDLSDTIAYNIARELDVGSESLVRSSGRFAFNGNNAWKNTGVPLHRGAQKYYEDRGYLT